MGPIVLKRGVKGTGIAFLIQATHPQGSSQPGHSKNLAMGLDGELAVGRNGAEIQSAQTIEGIPISDPKGVIIDEIVLGQLLGKAEPCSRATIGRQVAEVRAKVDWPGTDRFEVSPHHPGGLQCLTKNEPVDPFDIKQSLVFETPTSR